jgi:hypothetical protein
VCDICQSSPAVSLCHEDRAFLCRACDASIHSANAHVAAHSRFLFTNVKLELEAVGASKKRKAAEMNERDEKPRVSVSGDFAVPSFGYHQLEQRVPDASLHAENSHYDVVADGPNTDPFAAEFLHLDGGDGRPGEKRSLGRTRRLGAFRLGVFRRRRRRRRRLRSGARVLSGGATYDQTRGAKDQTLYCYFTT